MDKFKEKNPLSLRERQVLRMLAQGDEYSQISHNLNISINTVKFHVDWPPESPDNQYHLFK